MAYSFLGLDLPIIASGCAGGLSLVYAVHTVKKPEPWEIEAGLITGGFTANYVAPHITDPTGPWILFAGFVMGIAGKLFCLAALEFVRGKLPHREP